MQVLIDATPLLIRSAGVKNYLYHWVSSLRRAAGPDRIRCFPELDLSEPLRHDRSVAGFGQTTATLATLAASNHLGLDFLERRARDASIFHASSLVRQPPRRPRLTTTLHDLTSWILPELHTEANRAADRNLAEILKRADGIIAVSESTRNDAVKLLGIPAHKITVIHSGIAESFFNVDPARVAWVRERYSLDRPMVLYVGTIEPRKNIDGLLDAWIALPGSLRDEFELVMAGPMGWAPESTKQRVQRVRYLGYVPEEHLAPLTAAASVFVYPSLYEGFGFPVAQAMAAGVAVLTSNISSLPEITGDAAVLVDPRSVSEMRDGLIRLLLSQEFRARLANRGQERAARFRWENCAAQSLLFFDTVAG